MTEAVSLGELLHEEALFGLTGASERCEYPEEFPSGLCLSAISQVVARPFTNGVDSLA